MHLQGRVAKHSAQLGFRDDFGGHQIQQHDFQRTDVLGLCPGLLHDEYIFFLEHFRCRKVIGNLNRHGYALLMILIYTCSRA